MLQVARKAKPPPTKTPGYGLVDVGAYGGEPTIAASTTGELYDTTPSGGTLLYKSTDQGATWTQATTADPSSGDDCVFTDQSNAVYECNLAGSESTAPLQADIWKSTDDGQSWMYGNNNVNLAASTNLCGTSCSPFGVDRQWGAANIPAGGSTNTATVILMYHDFYGPSQIWINVSIDGGKTFGYEQWLSAGELGHYRKRVIAYQLGEARDALFEVVVSDPVAWYLTAAFLNIDQGYL